MQRIQTDIARISADIAVVQAQTPEITKNPSSSVPTSSNANFDFPDSPTVPSEDVDEEISAPPGNEKRLERVMENFDTLLSAYLDSIKPQSHVGDSPIGITFTEKFKKYNRFSRLRTLANLHYADSFFQNTNSIVSSIEFDKDDGILCICNAIEFFATAGVTRKIKIFEFGSIVHDYRQDGFQDASSYQPEIGNTMGGIDGVARYPILEMQCKSKISCLAFSSLEKSQLISSDYEGVVTLWVLISL
jgi:E3 ubiquitin-protein ligase RFWD2